MNNFFKVLGVVSGITGIITVTYNIISAVYDHKTEDSRLQKEAAYKATAEKYIRDGYCWDVKSSTWVKLSIK